MPKSVEMTQVTMDWLMDDTIQAGSGLSLARMTVPAGVISEAHRHPDCTEAIHVLSGTVRQRIGDNWREMRAGDTCLIPARQVHQTENTSAETAIMMVSYSSGSRTYLKAE